MLLRRGLASAVAQGQQTSRPNPMVEPIQHNISHLPSGLSVSSVDMKGGVSQLLFAFRSGSRYQQPGEGGLAHLLRNTMGTDSDHYSGLRLLWQTGLCGASLQSRVSKDWHCVQMTVTRTQAPIALSVLGEIVQPAIKPWDILSVNQGLEEDLKSATTKEKVLEGLHRAAYRNGPLANPLLCEPFEVGNDTNTRYQPLAAFVHSRWKAGDSALIGVNIDHTLLLEYATEHKPVPEGNAHPANPTPFRGGDFRQPGPGSQAHVAVAGEGTGQNNEKAVAIQAVLCALIGESGQYTRNQGIAQPGLVHQAVHKASNHNPFSIAPLNVCHSDSGLAGFYLVAEGSKIHSYVKAAVQGLRELATKPVDQETLQIAQKTVQLQALIRAQSSELLAMDQAVQVLSRGHAQSPEEFNKLVQQVGAEDVKKAAAKLCTKLAMSAYGPLNQVPYVDEL